MEGSADLSELAQLDDDFNQARYRSRYGFGISPALERAKVAREPKPVQPITATAKPLPATAPAKGPLPEIVDYESLIRVCRARAEQLDISRECIDSIAGWCDGLASKLLTTSPITKDDLERRPTGRGLGFRTLGPMLAALGIKLIAVLNEDTLARYQDRRTKRDAAHVVSAMARWEAPPGTPTRRGRARK